MAADGEPRDGLRKAIAADAKPFENRRQAIAAEAAARAKREWQLTKPFTDYAGKYRNDLLGTIEIKAKEKALAVRMGNMYTVATPYTQKDTIRVVMQPGGNGDVIGFSKDASDPTEDRIVELRGSDIHEGRNVVAKKCKNVLP